MSDPAPVRRPWTPDRVNPDGSRTVTMKRCCNGCGEPVGDVSLIEVDAGATGAALPDVRGECPRCCPIHNPPEEKLPVTEPVSPETPARSKIVRDMRLTAARSATRATRVFDRTLIEDHKNPGPMPPALRELNLMAHYGSYHGYAVAALLDEIEERWGFAAAEEMVDVVSDIAYNGDDGRCADLWPEIEAKLAEEAEEDRRDEAGQPPQ